MDMRIFSDTPRDRPVFDAYPMPPSGIFPNIPNINTTGAGLQVPNQGQNFLPPTSPFTFSVDPTMASFPAFDPRTFGATTSVPILDPAVESMLASYFPQAQGANQSTAGAAAAPQVPDDFLSRMFSFGWDGGQQPMTGQLPENTMGMDMSGMGYDQWGSHGWMA